MDINKIIEIIPFLKNGSYFLKFIFIIFVLSASYLIISFVSYKLSEKQKKENIELKKIQQINFTNFIDRLNSNSETIRNAAVIELGEISKNDEFQNKIIQILISHIRENSEKFDENIDIYKSYNIRTDIQNALKIIGKRKVILDKDLNFDFKDLNFNGIILNSVNLSQMDFTGSQFVHSKITNSNFDQTSLECCDFRHSDLSNSILTNSKIGGCFFELAKLKNCDFTNSHLGNSKFKNLSFDHSNFLNVTMFSTEFNNVNMSNVKNLNQDKLYWAYGEKSELPDNFILRKTPLIILSDEEKGYKNRRPIIYGIEKEKEALKFYLKKK